MNSYEAVQNASVTIEREQSLSLNVGGSLGREEGIPWVWVTGGALVCLLLMVLTLFGVVAVQGLSAFWPRDVLQVATDKGAVAGIAVRTDGAKEEKTVLFLGNQDISSQDFTYVDTKAVAAAKPLPGVWHIERHEWGPFLGFVDAVSSGSGTWSSGGNVKESFLQAMGAARDRAGKMESLEHDVLQDINAGIEEVRLDRRSAAREGATDLTRFDARLAELEARHEKAARELQALRAADARFQVRLRTLEGTTKEMPLSGIVRAFEPNELGVFGKLRVFLSRAWEFVSAKPREANTAGGVFPALFGTLAMTLLMSAAVMPFGVITAIFIREIATQGALVSLIRIAVSNLAGVPSIVYGIFGMGFFCYTLGVSIDELFFSEKLPSPTFGTGGILWASLTLALLTVPVVIVSTEEALSAVPRSLREGSLACGATRLQTLLRIVLPKAMPGIMTGLILAMARGMGEVAPLILTGAVKLAPELPIDGRFPFVHLERSFMHLGFHIYDLGFQSRSSEASRPMVFASTLLLIALVLALNLVAIRVRQRLRRRFEGRGAF